MGISPFIRAYDSLGCLHLLVCANCFRVDIKNRSLYALFKSLCTFYSA